MAEIKLIHKKPAILQMVTERNLRAKMRYKKLHCWIEDELQVFEIPLPIWETLRNMVPPSGSILLGGYEIHLDASEAEGRPQIHRYATHFLRLTDA